MEPAAHDDGRLTIIEADTIQLLPAARRQLECLLDAAAIARITQLADPTMAWPEVLALTLGPKLVGLDVSILTWFHVATQLRRPQVFDVFSRIGDTLGGRRREARLCSPDAEVAACTAQNSKRAVETRSE